jgi:hypothetical protein
VILDGAMLMRYSGHEVVVVLDDLNELCAARLSVNADFRREARKSRKAECENMARLLDAADHAGRRLKALRLGVADVFELLDEQILEELFPDFPGHQAARDAYRREERKGQNYWGYLEDALGLPAKAVDTYERVAGEMRRRGRVPPLAETLVRQVETLAERSDNLGLRDGLEGRETGKTE